MAGDLPAKARASPLYLGLDFSTQQLKVVCVDECLEITHEKSVVFDSDLPEFGTSGGVHKHSDGVTVTAPTVMWIKALDRLLICMQGEGFPFWRVASISGSGQQHGSVYWGPGARDALGGAKPRETLHTQLKDCFTIPHSPVWMDSSTVGQCRRLEGRCNGALELARKTGSRAYERFTGNQIAKIYQERETNASYKDFEKTDRISLVSSFGASLLLGDYAAIDYSDASGMNLLDISTKCWWTTAMDACAPDLARLLGNPVPSNTVLGCVSQYFVERYGFPASCRVVAFAGDNPASLAGMRLQQGDIGVSLGTSDTVFVWITEARPQLMGHIFANPVDTEAFMALLCYKNGSCVREVVRDEVCPEGTWDDFNVLLKQTRPGNGGNIGFYFKDPEITPSGLQGDFRFNDRDEQLKSGERFSKEIEARAVLEGQFLAKFIHARRLGFEITSSTRVLATGGASLNKEILQILADVFGSAVYTLEGTANSASLGAAYRAMHSLQPGVPFSEAVGTVPEAQDYKLAVHPQPSVHQQVYLPMAVRYASLEARLTEMEGDLADNV